MFNEDVGTIKDCYIRAIVHQFDINEFEVLSEDFFYTFNSAGNNLSQSDLLGTDFEYEFRNEVLNEKFEVSTIHEIVVRFNIHHFKEWTSCGYEYDSSIEINEWTSKLVTAFSIDDFKFEG